MMERIRLSFREARRAGGRQERGQERGGLGYASASGMGLLLCYYVVP